MSLIKKIKVVASSCWKKFRGKFIQESPGKWSIDIGALGVALLPVFLIFVIFYSLLGSPEDTSRLAKSSDSINAKFPDGAETKAAFESLKGLANQKESQRESNRSAESQAKPVAITYRAKQVMEREDYADPSNSLPVGVEFVGKLLTSIDTRQLSSLIKVEVPYGASFLGNEAMPKGSVLFATVKYDGNGEKVFLEIHSGAYSNGQGFKVRAQALSAKDFSPGIEGDFHGTFSDRVAANLGLSFVSALTDTLTEKESLGGGGMLSPTAVSPKPTIRNGVLAGISKVTDVESQQMAKELSSKQPYVTVASGKEMIISLLERFTKGK